jgi:hypothetical protein
VSCSAISLRTFGVSSWISVADTRVTISRTIVRSRSWTFHSYQLAPPHSSTIALTEPSLSLIRVFTSNVTLRLSWVRSWKSSL